MAPTGEPPGPPSETAETDEFFSATVDVDGDVVRVTIAGELDLVTAPEANEVVHAHARPGALVVLDLTGLTFLDSSGLQLLVGCHRASRREEWTLRIVAPQGNARRPIELSGLDRVLPLEDPSGS
jgi:anti-anti-sigma factor